MDLEVVRHSNIEILKRSAPSTDPSDYYIQITDFKRKSGVDRAYLINWYLKLLRTYECRCGICGDDSSGLELDHFFVPKDRGGNLIMLTRDGDSINNAVPLCMTCNRSKSTKQPSISTVNDDKFARILVRNRFMTSLINHKAFKLLDLMPYMGGPFTSKNTCLNSLLKFVDGPDGAYFREALLVDVNKYIYSPIVDLREYGLALTL